MAAIVIDWDSTVDGKVAFLGPKEDGKKLAVLGTKHFQGLVRNGQLVYEPMRRGDWGIHWTAPSMRLEVIEAVLKSLPEEA